MRILQVGKYYPPFHGGMERVVAELSEGLAACGDKVRAVVASSSGAPAREMRRGVEVIHLRTRGQFLSQPLITGLNHAIADFQPDVVHFHLPNPLALWQGWPRGIATFLTLHAEAGGLKGPIDQWWTRRFARRAQAIIFSSALMARRWEGLINTERLHVIPFGFRFDYLQGSSDAPDLHLILFVGRLVDYKGIDTLLMAMRRVNGRLAIIGDGPERDRLRGLARDLGVVNRIQFVGSVPDEDLARWYARASIYVQPSLNSSEAFGISMLEAMRMARPVVSTDLSTGVQVVNRHGVTGLVVPPGDSNSLAAALNTLLRDSDLALRLGRNAELHQRGFSSDLMIRRHRVLYERLAEGSRVEPLSRTPSVDIH